MPLIVDGRTYAPVRHTTFAQDIFVRQQVRKAGLDHLALRAGEAPAAFVDRLLDDLASTGTLFPMLAGLLVPDGASWSEATAVATIDTFSNVTDPQIKAQLRGEVASLLAHFFASGTVSAVISPSSSADPAAAPARNAERSSSATGPASSG